MNTSGSSTIWWQPVQISRIGVGGHQKWCWAAFDAALDQEAYFTLHPYGRVEFVETGFPLNRASSADLT